MQTVSQFQEAILEGIPEHLPPVILDPTVSHAPRRVIKDVLTLKEKLALAMRFATSQKNITKP